ncbi:hypothetical protein [Microcoleus sp.]|uniref:hypothetical protein n=1 Tax=Microcoleus sp. TaxID=44472 RepID=UPI003592EC41
MLLLRTLGYNLVKIQVADWMGVAGENVLGFALGEKLEKKSSIAPRTAKKDRSPGPVNSTGDRTTAAFSGPPQLSCTLAATPKSRRRTTRQNLQQQRGAEIAMSRKATTELDRVQTFDNL